jgi:ABC-2 type transport system permease protein
MGALRKTLSVCRKELAIYFATPPAYVFWAVTLAACSLWFWFANLTQARDANLRYLISFMVLTMLFLAPVVTMRLVAEERSGGTLELLLTCPVHEWQIVIGKWMGVVSVLLTLLALSLVYPLILLALADWRWAAGPDLGVVVGQYAGLVLVASACGAAGIFFSSLTARQWVAALLGVVAVLGLIVVQAMGELTPGVAGQVFRALSVMNHLESFSTGVIDSLDVYYFVAVTAVFLFLSIRALEARRWARP